MSNEYRCVDCGTFLTPGTGLGYPARELITGRTHTYGGCIEYLKAALAGAEREVRMLQDIISNGGVS